MSHCIFTQLQLNIPRIRTSWAPFICFPHGGLENFFFSVIVIVVPVRLQYMDKCEPSLNASTIQPNKAHYVTRMGEPRKVWTTTVMELRLLQLVKCRKCSKQNEIDAPHMCRNEFWIRIFIDILETIMNFTKCDKSVNFDYNYWIWKSVFLNYVLHVVSFGLCVTSIVCSSFWLVNCKRIYENDILAWMRWMIFWLNIWHSNPNWKIDPNLFQLILEHWQFWGYQFSHAIFTVY